MALSLRDRRALVDASKVLLDNRLANLAEQVLDALSDLDEEED